MQSPGLNKDARKNEYVWYREIVETGRGLDIMF